MRCVCAVVDVYPEVYEFIRLVLESKDNFLKRFEQRPVVTINMVEVRS